jgi:hypothetical protein
LDGYSPVLKNSSSVLVDLLSVLHATNRLDIFFASYPHEAHAWKDIGAFFTNILLYLPRWFIAYVMLCGSHVKRVLLGERNWRDWKKKWTTKESMAKAADEVRHVFHNSIHFTVSLCIFGMFVPELTVKKFFVGLGHNASILDKLPPKLSALTPDILYWVPHPSGSGGFLWIGDVKSFTTNERCYASLAGEVTKCFRQAGVLVTVFEIYVVVPIADPNLSPTIRLHPPGTAFPYDLAGALSQLRTKALLHALQKDFYFWTAEVNVKKDKAEPNVVVFGVFFCFFAVLVVLICIFALVRELRKTLA